MNTQSNQETQYDGHCAFAVSLGKKDVIGKQKCFLIQEDNKYLFSNSVAKLLWRVSPGQKDKPIRFGPLNRKINLECKS